LPGDVVQARCKAKAEQRAQAKKSVIRGTVRIGVVLDDLPGALPQAKCYRAMFVASAKMLPMNARGAVAHNSSM
jgi:hypothetical protein